MNLTILKEADIEIPERFRAVQRAKDYAPLGELTIWEVWAKLNRSPVARQFLVTLAMNPTSSIAGIWRIMGKNSKNYAALEEWRKNYPGYSELEMTIREDPLAAAHFLSIAYLAPAIGFCGEVLTSKTGYTKTEKMRAAAYIVQISGVGAVRGGPKSKPVASAAETDSLEEMRRIAGEDNDE